MFGISISYYVDKALGREYIYNYLFETPLVGIKSVWLKVQNIGRNNHWKTTILSNKKIEKTGTYSDIFSQTLRRHTQPQQSCRV